MKRFDEILSWGTKIAVVGATALVVVALLVSAQTKKQPSRYTLPDRTTGVPLTWSQTQTTTCGNFWYEATSLTLDADTRAVAVWCSGENAMVNWWSTAKTDLGTTNGWYLAKDTAPQVLDRYVLGVTAAGSPSATSTSIVLWFASRSATSATVNVIEFTSD